MKPGIHSPLADRKLIAAFTPRAGLFWVAHQFFPGLTRLQLLFS